MKIDTIFVLENQLYYQSKCHSTESIVKRSRNPRLIREYEFSNGGEGKGDLSIIRPPPHDPELRPEASENLNPVEAIAEIKKLMVLRR
jgi:hypothetical protein